MEDYTPNPKLFAALTYRTAKTKPLRLKRTAANKSSALPIHGQLHGEACSTQPASLLSFTACAKHLATSKANRLQKTIFSRPDAKIERPASRAEGSLFHQQSGLNVWPRLRQNRSS